MTKPLVTKPLVTKATGENAAGKSLMKVSSGKVYLPNLCHPCKDLSWIN